MEDVIELRGQRPLPYTRFRPPKRAEGDRPRARPRVPLRHNNTRTCAPPPRAHAPRGSGGGDGHARGARCPHVAPSAGIAAPPAPRTAPRRTRGPGGGCAVGGLWWAQRVRRRRQERGAAAPSEFPGGDVAGRGPLRKAGAATGRPVRRRWGRPRRSAWTRHGLRHVLTEQVQ